MNYFHRYLQSVLLIVGLSFGAPAHAMSFFPFGTLTGGGKDINIAFLKSSDAARKHEQISRQQQLTKLQGQQAALDVRARKEQEQQRKRIIAWRQELEHVPDGVAAQEIASLFGERNKIASAVIDTFDELRKVLGEHEAMLKRFIGTLENDRKDADDTEQTFKLTWAQFKSLQQEIEEQKSKDASLKEKNDLLLRDGMRIREQHQLQKKQLQQSIGDSQKKEFEATTGAVQEQYRTLRSIQEALASELALYTSLSEELHDARAALLSDEISLQRYVVGEKKRRISILKDHISFPSKDIDYARQALQEKEVAVAQVSEAINVEQQKIKADKDELVKRRDILASIESDTQAHKAETQFIARRLMLAELQQALLAYRLELAEGEAEQARLTLKISEVMSQRQTDATGRIVAQHIDEWLLLFRQRRERITSFLEHLNDREKEGRLREEEHRGYAGSIASQQSSTPAITQTYQQIAAIVKNLLLIDREIASLNAQQTQQYKKMSYDVAFVLSVLEGDQYSLNIWQRSDKALSPNDLRRALFDARQFCAYLYRSSLNAFNPGVIVRELCSQSPFDYLLLLFLIVFLLFFIATFRMLVSVLGRYIDRMLYIYQGQSWAIYLTILRSFIRFMEQHGRSMSVWLFVRLHLAFEFEYVFMGMQPLVSPYTVALFYLCSIPFFLYLSRQLMQEIKMMNQRMSFLFFTETLQEKFLLLLSSILYSSAVLLPLRRAFLDYPFSASTALPNVIYGAWLLIVSIVFLFLFSKEDVLRIIPSSGAIGQWVRGLVDRYYYPVFIFIMGLCILVNPYVGFSNFAVYLAICVPISVAILYALITLHTYIRRYSMVIFIREDPGEDDEGEDRFEYAKLYYGIFVLMSFLVLAAISFVGITRIWGINYTFGKLWKGLSQDWVLTIEGTGVHVGFGGLLTLGLFIVGAFVVSSLFNRFVLSKLFDIFRVAPGAQNTVVRMLHYTIILMAIILGLHAVRLGSIGNGVLIGLLFGISFGAKDLVSDFFAGVWILLERPIEPGNFIQTGELRGTVKKIAVRATTIRTARNFSVVVPNRELVAKPIINWGGNYYAVGFEMKVTVSYHADPKEVQELIRQVVSSNGLVLRIPAVAVRLDEFGDYGMEYFVRAFISSRRVRDQWDIASDIRIELIKVFQEHNIGIPYPHMVLQHENAFGLTKETYQQMVDSEEGSNSSSS